MSLDRSTLSVHSLIGERSWRRYVTGESEVTRRILAVYEAGDLITMCAWCHRIEIDGEWHPAPRAALTAIDSRYTLSHTICPACGAAGGDQPRGAV